MGGIWCFMPYEAVTANRQAMARCVADDHWFDTGVGLMYFALGNDLFFARKHNSPDLRGKRGKILLLPHCPKLRRKFSLPNFCLRVQG